jgi:hypothetical protein
MQQLEQRSKPGHHGSDSRGEVRGGDLDYLCHSSIAFRWRATVKTALFTFLEFSSAQTVQNLVSRRKKLWFVSEWRDRLRAVKLTYHQ